MVVQGAVNPDEFYISKPLLNAESTLSSVVILVLNAKMIYGEEAFWVNQLLWLMLKNKERQQFALNDHELQELAKQALIIETIMVLQWTLSGQRWR